ncbi:YihY/virulence factor BrkB family protein [Salinibacterium sp. SYSU T00001]|uniref:YihY/virulence factor BrkB family protein n=1 Tax=Homoserinimonas sedimenticola TaxID=2986805 RepID=UPI0022364204|nr:YihY/virulence factor BrkB family protein [Salinibacterium sedimenticola]MCW4385122.1 YihY/virulence factor BrkB family protein [Salinibacterium sedimenticola]
MAKLKEFIAKVMASRPVRVFQHYALKRGPILASGLSYQAIFAVFAALWVAFSVAGLVITGNPELQRGFFTLLDSSVPGLIDSGDGEGAIDPADLTSAGVFGWTGAIALGGLLFTALGWLASCRDAVRVMFELPPERLNVVLLRLKDVGLGLLFGVALIVSAALLVFSTQAVEWVFGLVGIAQDSIVARVTGRVVGLLLMFLLDAVTLAGLYRWLSGLKIPGRRLLVGSVLGAAGLGVLKVLGSTLLGGATNNPLLASFAVIIGLLIWFNFLCQVILIGGAWIAVGMLDRGLGADPVVAAERQRQRELELAHDAAVREEARRRLARIRRTRRWGWLFGR